MDRYWDPLVAWVGGPRSAAEDAVQSAFIKLAAESSAPENIVAWLFTVTRRIAINDHRASSRRRSRETLAASLNPESDSSFAEVFEIREILDRLEARQRQVVVGRVWGELSFDEIATLMNESKATVWRVYQQGIEQLRKVYVESKHE